MGAAAMPIAMAGSSIIGGMAQSSAARKAAKAQQYAVSQANKQQREFFDITQQNLKPYMNTGAAATRKISQLQGLEGGTPSSIQATLQSLPGYQFMNTQGLKSTQNSATARGLGVSGAALKAAGNYSTGLANQYYNNLLTGLQTTASTGANAAAGLGNNATTAGGNIGANTIGGGNAMAAANIAQGSAIGNAVGGIPSALIANALFSGGGGGSNNNGGGGSSDSASQGYLFDPNAWNGEWNNYGNSGGYGSGL